MGESKSPALPLGDGAAYYALYRYQFLCWGIFAQSAEGICLLDVSAICTMTVYHAQGCSVNCCTIIKSGQLAVSNSKYNLQKF